MTASKDHDLLVRMDENVTQILSEAKRTNGRITTVEGHQAEHCKEIAVIKTRMDERTNYGWPTSKKRFIGGGTLLVVIGTVAGSAIARAIDVWPWG